MTDPNIGEKERSDLTKRLMAARRAVRHSKTAGDADAKAAAHRAVDDAKRALGERGPVWWKDGAPDLNSMAKNTLYAEWYADLSRSRR